MLQHCNEIALCVRQLGDTEVLTEEVMLAGSELTVTLVARDGTKAVRRLSKM